MRHQSVYSRTTLTLDSEIAAKAKRSAKKLGKLLKGVINPAAGGSGLA
jgi:hypothetical protein